MTIGGDTGRHSLPPWGRSLASKASVRWHGEAVTDEVLVRLPFIQRQLYAEGLSRWGTVERIFFGGLAQKPGNFALAHAARELLVSMVFGCRPPFPLGISDIGW